MSCHIQRTIDKSWRRDAVTKFVTMLGKLKLFLFFLHELYFWLYSRDKSGKYCKGIIVI
jgi:hypothetical protein